MKIYIAGPYSSGDVAQNVRNAINAKDKGMKALRLFLMWLGFSPPLITDDYQYVEGWCRRCGADIVVIRPGKFRCSEECDR